MDKKLLLLLSSLLLIFACSKDDAPTDPNAKFKESTWEGTLTFNGKRSTVYLIRIVFDKDGLADLYYQYKKSENEPETELSLDNIKMVKTSKTLEWKGFKEWTIFSGIWFITKETDDSIEFDVDKRSSGSDRTIKLKRI